MFTVAILAGGLATRLRPITEKIPKALVEVAGRPFINWQLEDLARQGVKQVVMCTGYLGEQIEATVGNGRQFGIEAIYSPDGPVLLGTGGALRKALPALGDHFFVLYGDSFLPINYAEVAAAFAAFEKPALMTVLRNGDRWDKSNVLYLDGHLQEYNKRTPSPEMTYIDYGLGVLSASVLEPYPLGESFDLADVYQKLSLKDKLAGLEVYERFFEIGSHTGLKEAEEYFLKKEKI